MSGRSRPRSARAAPRRQVFSCTTGGVDRKVAARIAELVPSQSRVAHGQMNEHTLRNIMVDFWDGKYDVLVRPPSSSPAWTYERQHLIVDARTLRPVQLHQLRAG